MRTESHSQQFLNVSHDLDEVRVQVPDDWFREGCIDPRINHGGTRPEQITARRLQRRKQVQCCNVLFDGAHIPSFLDQKVQLDITLRNE